MSETLDLDLQVYFVKKYVKLFQFIVTLPFIFPILNPLTTNVPHHIETSQLICYANQLTGFYMLGNAGRHCWSFLQRYKKGRNTCNGLFSFLKK